MSESQRHQERGLARHSIQKLVKVYDASQGVPLGQLVNIHTEGLMVMGEATVNPDHIYQLELRLPFPIDGFDHIRVGADCLWVRQIGESSTHWAGFHIIDLSDSAARQIDVLVQQLGE